MEVFKENIRVKKYFHSPFLPLEFVFLFEVFLD